MCIVLPWKLSQAVIIELAKRSQSGGGFSPAFQPASQPAGQIMHSGSATTASQAAAAHA